MNKEILQVEFRYDVIPNAEYHSTHDIRKVTIGIYDTLEEAVIEGNKVIDKLKDKFKLTDRLSTKGLIPNRIVCKFNRGVQVFVIVETLKFDDVEEVMNMAFESQKKYDKWNK